MAEPRPQDTDTTSADTVAALAETVAALRAERDGLRAAMRHRAVIEQAKGALAFRWGISPEAAFERLVEQSTHSNTKVAELAAAVIAEHAPRPPRLTEHDVAPPATTRPTPAADRSRVGSVPARVRLLTARIDAATSADDIAAALLADTDGWPAPDDVMVLLVTADGTLRLVGSAGLSRTAAGQWRTVPPIRHIPVAAALGSNAPVYLTGDAAGAGRVPADPRPGALVALPLVHRGRRLGALQLRWRTAIRIPKPDRDHLFTVAAPVARRCAALPEDHRETDTARSWLAALTDPAALLAPRHDADGTVMDFDPIVVSEAGSMSLTEAGIDAAGGSLLTVLPQIGARTLVPMLASVLRTGEPARLRDVPIPLRDGAGHGRRVDVAAGRLRDMVLVSWRVADTATALHRQLTATEERQRVGSLELDTVTGCWCCSPGLTRLLRPDLDESGVDSTVELVRSVTAADGNRLRDLLATPPSETTVARLHGVGPIAGRIVDVTISRAGDRVLGSARDVTDQVRTTEQLARERMSAAAHRARPEPAIPAHPCDVPGIRVVGPSHDPADSGCWHDTVPAPDGTVVVVLGEIDGPNPVVTVTRLRHAAIGYAVTGTEPSTLLAALNLLCRRVSPDRTAAVAVVRIDPGTGGADCAVAGLITPILFRADGSVRLSPGAPGPPVGAVVDPAYPTTRLALADQDRLVLAGAALTSVPGCTLSRTFSALADISGADTADTALDRLRDRLPGTVSTALVAVRRERTD